jgi:hypothetical protein
MDWVMVMLTVLKDMYPKAMSQKKYKKTFLNWGGSL